jgi:hypothetical protein
MYIGTHQDTVHVQPTALSSGSLNHPNSIPVRLIAISASQVKSMYTKYIVSLILLTPVSVDSKISIK